MLIVSSLSRVGLAPVSFCLETGECMVVQGASGSGKTLLLRAIADLDPCAGAVSLDNVPREAMSGPAWRCKVGYLPAEPGWWADRIGEHFEDWSAARDLMRRFGLPEAAKDWPVARPSTGERMRLALIRALVRHPEVLLLDEPTASLDPQSVAVAEAVIAEKVAAGLSVLWVSHDPAQAARLGGRVLIVEAGHVREGERS